MRHSVSYLDVRTLTHEPIVNLKPIHCITKQNLCKKDSKKLNTLGKADAFTWGPNIIK